MIYRYLCRATLIALALAAFCASAAVRAEGVAVAVVYPDLRDPFRTVFQEIINGIEQGFKAPVKPYVLAEDAEGDAVKAQLEQDHVPIAITLGRAGLVSARMLSDAMPVVVGAAFISPDVEKPGMSGITLSPDPEAMLGKLKALVPDIRRVSVVYDPKRNEWEIDKARKVAKELGVQLNALPAEDVRSAAAHYRNLLDESKDAGSAIWLLQDNAVTDERTLLPVILKDAWDSNLVVFSSNPDHVRKGALFSMYPDNTAMGRSLGVMARNRLQNGTAKTGSIEPLRDLLLAVNIRTAEHLGLRFESQERQKFDLVFPASR
ncbi:MAG: hypothetical protein EPN21_01830 [Methylococcaceae bacterium]|nr:MAG: hypothetical protein EPN21_01830 [Methylococcaceae bacterium]